MSASTLTPAVVAESHRILRERRFSLDDGDNSVLAALSHLRREGSPGTLTLHIGTGGGLCAIVFLEQQSIDPQ